MTANDLAMHEPKTRSGIDTVLLLLAMILLIAGFPSFLFGVFLFLSQGPGGMGDVAFGFSFGGFVAVVCALGIRAYLRRRDAWL